MAYIGANQIAILGGYNGRCIGDGYIIDTENGTILRQCLVPQKQQTDDFRFRTASNQCQAVGQGKVCALVADKNYILYLVSFCLTDDSDNSVKIVKSIGKL